MSKLLKLTRKDRFVRDKLLKFNECLSQWGGIGLPIVSLSGDISPVIFPYCAYSQTKSFVSEFLIHIYKMRNIYFVVQN